MAEASHPKAGASHKRVGSMVRGKYRVEAFLATGTMGNVYAATHRNGSRVALKILHTKLAEDPSLCERFKREGYFANSIGHPGIVRAIDDDITEDGCPFLVMELLEGETLEERRRRKGGKLPLSWVLPVADSLLEILAAAHAREVVHRDLKPDNVFVTKAGDVKVLDFGVARWNDGKSSSDMTGVGMVLGTPAYMPPEQALGRREDVDARSDLWAVGATLFVVLSGESVHAGGDAKAKLIATARTAARPLREAAPDVPRVVATVIDRALAFHKKERWPDAMAMREALRWARMSVEERPSQALRASSDTDLEPIPPPIPTRRAIDDEPTVMRLARDDAPQSKDFLTSAPPITLRDLPMGRKTDPGGLIVAHNNEPVFSLRRMKEESPSTERLPSADDAYGVRSEPMDHADIAHAKAMPTYDPADAMGDEMPVSAPTVARSLDVNMSFTRPMATFVLPDGYDAPRPAAGVTAPAFPDQRATDPAFPDRPTAPAFPEHRATAPFLPDYAAPPPAFPDHGAVPAHLSSAPFGSMPTQPGLLSSAPFGSMPTPAYLPSSPDGSAPPDGSVPLHGSASAHEAGPPAPFPESPGPMLSQIVKPRRRLARVVVPLTLALVATLAAFLVVRARAAHPRGGAAAAVAAATTVSTQPRASASVGATGTTPAAAAVASSGIVDASPRPATVAPAPSSVALASADPPKRPPRPRPKKKPAVVKPVEPAGEATATAAAAATNEPPPPPAETTPKEAPTAKDPEPKPAVPAPPVLGGDNSGI